MNYYHLLNIVFNFGPFITREILTDWRHCRGKHAVKEIGLCNSCMKIPIKCLWCDTRWKATNINVFPLR